MLWYYYSIFLPKLYNQKEFWCWDGSQPFYSFFMTKAVKHIYGPNITFITIKENKLPPGRENTPKN